MAENKHQRHITGHDGVSDDVAIAWSDREQDRRTWGIAPSHRRPELRVKPWVTAHLAD